MLFTTPPQGAEVAPRARQSEIPFSMAIKITREIMQACCPSVLTGRFNQIDPGIKSQCSERSPANNIRDWGKLIYIHQNIKKDLGPKDPEMENNYQSKMKA